MKQYIIKIFLGISFSIIALPAFACLDSKCVYVYNKTPYYANVYWRAAGCAETKEVKNFAGTADLLSDAFINQFRNSGNTAKSVSYICKKFTLAPNTMSSCKADNYNYPMGTSRRSVIIELVDEKGRVYALETCNLKCEMAQIEMTLDPKCMADPGNDDSFGKGICLKLTAANTNGIACDAQTQKIDSLVGGAVNAGANAANIVGSQ